MVAAADDTDVEVMLLYHYQNQILDIYFLQERGKKYWSIKEALKEVTCKEHLLFIHAWSGCDTTSSTFGKVKVTFMKMVQKSENVLCASEVMCDYWATKKEISEVSIKIFIEMYGGTNDCLLRKLRQDLLFHFSKFLLIECQQFLDIFHFHICSVCFFYQIVIFQHSRLHSHSNPI